MAIFDHMNNKLPSTTLVNPLEDGDNDNYVESKLVSGRRRTGSTAVTIITANEEAARPPPGRITSSHFINLGAHVGKLTEPQT